MFHELIQGLSNIPLSTLFTMSMIVLLAISVGIGFLRGMKKSIYYTITYVVALFIFMLSLNGITQSIVNSIIGGDTIQNTISSFLPNGEEQGIGEMFKVGSSSYTLVAVTLGFIIQFALTLGFIVFFEVIYKIIVWLLWILLFQRFDKKKIRKGGRIIYTKRQRLFGALIGLVPGLMSVLMLFVPISGIFEVASSITSSEKKEGVSFGNLLSEEDYNLLKNSLNSYDESLPGSTFNIFVSKDGRSLDVYLFDKLVTVTINEHEYNIRKDLENIGKFASNMSNIGLLELTSNENFTSYDLIETVDQNRDTIESSFEALGNVDLIDLILNTCVEYLDVTRIVDSSLELESGSINYENLSNLDWSSELKQLGKILVSAVDVLSALPETSIKQPFINLEDINKDIINNDLVLENFVDEVFKSNLINEASVAGLKYALGMDSVKEIVGEVKTSDLEDLDIKEDVLNIVNAVKSVVNIGVANFTTVNLQNLSSQSVELKNIIDEMLSLELFKIVEKNVLDYAITNYVESNEAVSKYVDLEELRKLELADYKRELGSVIETFGRLGNETELFVLDEIKLEDPNAYVNYYALDSKSIRIIVDNVDSSETIQKFMNKAMNGVLVPSVFEEDEEYNKMIQEEDFAWDDELYTFTNILEQVEKRDTEFNLYKSLNSDSFDITVGLLRGISARDELDSENYYIDESIFVKKVFTKIIDTQASENDLFADVFNDEDLSYGKEIESLTNILVEAEIVADSNDSVVDFNELQENFTSLNEKTLHAITNNIENSRIIQKVITNSVEEQLSPTLVDDMKNNWHHQEGRWHEEFAALTSILIDGEFTDDNGDVNIDEISGNMQEISYVQLDAAHQNIENSLIMQDLLAKTLVDNGVDLPDENNDGIYEINWKDETEVLRDIVASETYQYEENGKLVWSKMPVSELTDLSNIRPETLDLISRKVNKSIIIKNALKDPLRNLLKNDDDSIDSDLNPDNWDNETWVKELKSVSYVSTPLALRSIEKEEKGYPADRVYVNINEINVENKVKMQVFENMLGGKFETPSPLESILNKLTYIKRSNEINNDYGINHSRILRKLFKDAMIGSTNVEDESLPDYIYNVDYDSLSNDQYYYEVQAIINVCYNADLYVTEDGINYIVYDEITSKFNTITRKTIRGITSEVDKSVILQKQMQKNLQESLGREFTTIEMESWDKATWAFEMDSLSNIVDTMSDSDEEEIDLSSLKDNDTIKLSTILSIRDNSSSKVVKQSMKDKINDLLIIENSTKISCVPIYEENTLVYSGWDNRQWYYEMDTLHAICSDLSTDGITINVNNLKDSFSSIDMDLLEVLSNRVYGSIEGEEIKNNSYIMQAQITPSIENMMNAGERIDENRKRSLHPLSYTGTNWNQEENVPKYNETDFTLDGKVGEWWSEELEAVLEVAKAKFGENGTLSTGDITFNETDIYTLNTIRNYIDESYVIQSCMRSTVDGILNQDTEGSSPKHPNYETYTSEYWTGSQWVKEMIAIRDISKSLSTYEGDNYINLESNKVFKERNQYLPSQWIGNETYDKDFKFNLHGINIEGSGGFSLDTLYFVSVNSKDSYIVRSLIRPFIADLLGDVENDDFVEAWLDTNYKPVKDGLNNFVNRWDYEMEALFNVSGQLAKDGKINIDVNMLNKLPVSIFDTLNGAFKELNTSNTNRLDDEIIIDENNILENHGYVANYINNGTKHFYQSEIVVSLLNDSLRVEDVVEPNLWSDYQWAYEIYSLSKVATILADNNNEVEIKNIKFDDGINLELLNRLASVINFSTILQDKLNSSLFTIDNSLDSSKKEELRNAFPQFGFNESFNQWNYEIGALYDVLYGTTYVDPVTNLFNYKNLDFNGVIDASILYNIGENINYSTYLQSKLESTIEGLVPQEGDEFYILDREEYFEKDFVDGAHTHIFNESINDHTCSTCGYIKDYHLERFVDSLGNKHYKFNLKVKFNDPNYHAWSVELKTIFGIVLDEEDGLVEDGKVDISKVESELHSLSVNILSLTSNKLDQYGHDAYHSSNIVRLNLIKPLETLAYDGNTFDNQAQISSDNGFRWINEPIDIPAIHEFTYDVNTLVMSSFHRYDGLNSFEYMSNGNVLVNLSGWTYDSDGDSSTQNNKFAYNFKHELLLDDSLSTPTTKVYYQNGLDYNGNEHILYKMEINSDGTGKWYCIEKQSDLHELETFFKLIGAENLESAKLILANIANHSSIVSDTRISNVLKNESYYIGIVFNNRFSLIP